MAIAGDLADLGTADLLFLIRMRGMTGELLLQRGDEDACLVFEQGRLIRATSSAVSQRLGELLVHLGRLTEPQLAQALADQVRDPALRPLGARLVEQGLISDADLADVLTCQAEEILYRALAWQDGTFTFVTRPVASRAVPLPEINVERLVLDALRLADEHEAVRRRIPGLDYQVVIRSHADDMATDPLTLKESIVIASIERGAQTVRAVAEATRLSEVELLRLIDTLCQRNLLELVPPSKSPHDRRSTSPRAFRVLGRAAKATAAAPRPLAN